MASLTAVKMVVLRVPHSVAKTAENWAESSVEKWVC